jgi:deoxyribodipyrimidine photolyase-related protein
MFLSPTEWLTELFNGKKKYRMQNFYTAQRKRLNILITKDGKPVGGSWSFDKENRKSLPKNISIPKIYRPKENNYIKEAKEYIEEHFASNSGDITELYYPVTFDTAKKSLDDFLKNRLSLFGPYEDAINRSEPFLFHSLLSPLLNIGLLTPDYVVQKTLDYTKEHKTPINSVEGFIRQIIGWREYVRAVYILKDRELRSSNFFDHKNRLPRSFWTASTGIDPIDESIKAILESAYAHHIIRLMILGNFMLLCEIHPEESYRWFMEFFIDAYDWVMVPNVYGMSQYADADLMTTKPYISGSNYILKMSNFKKSEWCNIWDALYWHFIFKKQKKLSTTREFSSNRMRLTRIKQEKLKQHINTASIFLKKVITI